MMGWHGGAVCSVSASYPYISCSYYLSADRSPVEGESNCVNKCINDGVGSGFAMTLEKDILLTKDEWMTESIRTSRTVIWLRDLNICS